MKNKRSFIKCIERGIGFIVTMAFIMCSISGCVQNNGENTSESVTTGQIQNTAEAADTEESDVNNLLEQIAGSYYDERTNVKDIYGEIKAALGDAKIFGLNTVSNMKLVISLYGEDGLYITIYDIESGDISEKINIGGLDAMYYIYKDSHIVCTSYIDNKPKLIAYDMELNIVSEHEFPRCSDEELQDQKDGGMYVTEGSYFYNPETDVLFYVSGYGDVYGYSFADGSYTNYYKTENIDWGGADFIREACTDETLVYNIYGDNGSSTKIIDIASKEVESVWGECYYSSDYKDSSRNSLTCYGQDYKIYSDVVNVSLDYTIEYESAEMAWENETVLTFLENEKRLDDDTIESFSYAYNAYDMKTGALYSSLNLGSFDYMEYTESFNSHYKQGGIDVCGDLAVIRITDDMGELCNVLVWDYKQGILEDTSEYADELIKVNHEYDDMSNTDIENMLEEKYQIEIYYGEDVDDTQINDVYMTALYDDKYLHGVLINLAETLKLFPENLLGQLRYYGSEEKLRIYLCKKVEIEGNGIEEIGVHTVDGDASAVMLATENKFRLYSDIVDENKLRTTIVHEIFHGIMEYLEFDYDMWYAENPEGFMYYEILEDYNIQEDSQRYTACDENGEIYFAIDYSKVNVCEEVATLYEYSLFDDLDNTAEKMLESEHITNKVKMFNSWIRDYYDTTGWPEKTVWEELVE